MLAGAVMAGTSVPQLIAYAETVGYASYRGLSTAGPSLIAWVSETDTIKTRYHYVVVAHRFILCMHIFKGNFYWKPLDE